MSVPPAGGNASPLVPTPPLQRGPKQTWRGIRVMVRAKVEASVVVNASVERTNGRRAWVDFSIVGSHLSATP